MSSLLSRIRQHSGVAVIHHDGSEISYEQITQTVTQLQTTLKKKSSSLCVNNTLAYNNLDEFIVGLLALEGAADWVAIFPDHFEYGVFTGPPETVQTTLYLFTSGTTGAPKRISHSTASLCASIRISDHLKHLRWGLCYQADRFAGLQVILQSILSGSTLVDCAHGDIESRLSIMQALAVSAVSATPSLWRQFALSPLLDKIPLQYITLGGEIADEALLALLDTRFPNTNIYHIYASTEAGVGFAVSDKKAGFPKIWIDSGINGNHLKIDEDQQLWIKPAVPRRQQSENVDYDSQGYINTLDNVEVTNDRVMFKGRGNGAINVGGHKVFPEKVEQVLLLSSLVSQARVYGKNNSMLGQVVAADIVLTLDAQSLSTIKPSIAILMHCKKHLMRQDMPTKINIVTSLPLSSSGKLSR